MRSGAAKNLYIAENSLGMMWLNFIFLLNIAGLRLSSGMAYFFSNLARTFNILSKKAWSFLVCLLGIVFFKTGEGDIDILLDTEEVGLLGGGVQDKEVPPDGVKQLKTGSPMDNLRW